MKTLVLSLLVLATSCGKDKDSLRGYWKMDMDPNARRITQTVIEIGSDRLYALSYIGGPMLVPGQNTQDSDYALLGEVKCGVLEYEEESGIVTFSKSVKTTGEVTEGQAESYTVKIESDTSFYLSGQSQGLVGRYIRSGVKQEEFGTIERSKINCN